jgi:hypothetical protein
VIRALIVVACFAACDPVWGVEVHVIDVAGAPIVNASLALVDCPDQHEHSNGAYTSLTDERGDAAVTGVGYMPPCDIVVAAPGTVAFETSFDEICGGNLDDCDPIPHLDVTLAPGL